MAQQTIKKFFEHIEKGKNSLPFLLAVGPSHLGKTSLLHKYVKNLLGQFIHQDFLYIKDFSEILEKEHSLKIDSSTGEKAKILSKEHYYEDLGMRQINDRISKTPVGKYKIVLIENIERMTKSAMNAFLKTCEEPPQNTILLATSSSSESLLDTILSRAFLVRFHPLSIKQMKDFFNTIQKNIPDKDQEILALLSQGKPGLGIMLTQDPNHPLKQFRTRRHQQYTQKNTLLTEWYQLFQEIQRSGFLLLFLDILLGFQEAHGMYKKIPHITKIKRYIQSNVNKESTLFLLAKISS